MAHDAVSGTLHGPPPEELTSSWWGNPLLISKDSSRAFPSVVYLYPAGNAVASKSGKIPPFHHLCKGALPWYHTSFSTS